MVQFSNYRFIVGSISILSGILAAACIYVGALAVEFNFDAFSDPILTLHYAHNFELAKWFNLLDLFGYYLLLLPLIFYLHQQYKFKSPWVPLYTFCGCGYAIIGALGASILAALWPELMMDYLNANQETIHFTTMSFNTMTIMVTKGMWNILEVLFASVWWLGLASLLIKENKIIAFITMITGISTLLDANGNILNIPFLSEIGMNIYLVLGILWPIIMGIWIIKKSSITRHINDNTQV